jgi:hypothetical protein
MLQLLKILLILCWNILIYSARFIRAAKKPVAALSFAVGDRPIKYTNGRLAGARALSALATPIAVINPPAATITA